MTLSDIRRYADQAVATGTDSTTPPGTFYATTQVLGVTATYLLAGTPDDPGAPILGRIEYSHGHPPAAYIGNRLKGGQWTALTDDETEVFARMLAAHNRPSA